MADMIIGASVSARHGKRGWHIIPHADHIRSLGGLVHDGVLFSTQFSRASTSHTRGPLLGTTTDARTATSSLEATAEVEEVVVTKGQKTALHAAAAVGNLSQLRHLLNEVLESLLVLIYAVPLSDCL